MEQAGTVQAPPLTRAVYVSSDRDFTTRLNDVLRMRRDDGWRFVSATGDPSVFGQLLGMWLFFSKES